MTAVNPAKYELISRLGGGGMAEVFLARTVGAEGFRRMVAIKRVLPSFSEDEKFQPMFINEARLSSMLRHPAIVQVLDFDRDAEGRLFLVMELVEGKDLDAISSTGLLPIPVVIYVIGEVLEGLAYAHELTSAEGLLLGIVHRDVSPHNVLVTWQGHVKVSDFGIAKAMLASGVGQSGTIKGKPLYMAPEQVTNPGGVDGRADVFATGVMLYQLLTGQTLYQGTTNEEILTDVIQVAKGWRALIPAQAIRPDLPWDLVQVLHKMTAPDREHRFASAREAMEALHRCQHAPARGATLLAQCLAERFPAAVNAPRRSAMPAAAVVTPARAPVGAAIGPDAGTVVAPSAAHPMTLPMPVSTPTPFPGSTPSSQPVAIGSGQVAHSSVSGGIATPPSRRVLLAVVLVSILSLGIVAAALVVTRRREPARAPSSDSALAVAPAADAVVAVESVPDAGAALPPTARDAGTAAAAPPPDAGAVVAAVVDAAPAPVDAGRRSHRRPKKTADDEPATPPKPTGTGKLIVTAQPWALVTVDGQSFGQTPVSRSLPAGSHKLVLQKPDGTSETLRVEIRADRESRITRRY